MTGVIWVIQLVHYPTFHFVNPSLFIEFVNFHAGRISLIVTPLMVMELGAASVLVWSNHTSTARMAGLLLLIAIWLATFMLSVPCHSQLLKGYNAAITDKLIATNWIRTLGWSLRTAILLFPFLRNFASKLM